MGGRYLFATSTGEGHSCLVQECYVELGTGLPSSGEILCIMQGEQRNSKLV
jgi:hypothetical protein